MVKTTAIPQNNSYTLDIPSQYIGKKIEIFFYDVEEIIDKVETPKKINLSDKYKGIISKEHGKELNNHIKDMRNEWNNI